jgi:hypothetical protein
VENNIWETGLKGIMSWRLSNEDIPEQRDQACEEGIDGGRGDIVKPAMARIAKYDFGLDLCLGNSAQREWKFGRGQERYPIVSSSLLKTLSHVMAASRKTLPGT